MTVKIREARLEDADRLLAFQVAMARETEDLELDRVIALRGISRALSDPAKAFYLIAELEGRAVGGLMVTREWSDWRDGWIHWIQSVFVEPLARGQGIYGALHGHVLELSRADSDVRAVRLYVVESNERARQTYKKSGMHQTEYLIYEQTP